MNLLNDRFLFIDCQSTGAHPRNGHLLELAWCYASASDAAPCEIKCLLIKQPDSQPIPFRIQMITGITDDDMENAIEVSEVYSELQAQISTICGDRAVAHYATFERPFLSDLFQRHGADNFPLDLLCTYQIARRLFPDLPTRGIRGLGGFFGASDRELKRSSHHVETTLSIWRGLVAELIKEGVVCVDDLQEWLKKPGRVKAGKYQYPIAANKRLSLPQSPGIYKMLNKKREVLYVGKATSLKSRVNSYFTGRKGKDSRKLEMAMQTHDIAYIECGSALEAALMETDEIKQHNPPYNLSLKSRRRKLAFLCRELSSVSDVQSESHPVGPFSSSFVMEQFSRVFEWLSTGIADLYIFHGDVSEGLIEDGFALFCSLKQIDPANIATPRDLMALSIWLLRQQSIEEIIAGEHDFGEVDNNEEEDDEEEDDDDEPSLQEFTAEDVSGKFGRLFKRAAKAYLRGKILTRLLNCSLTFSERSRPRKLYVTNGVVSAKEIAPQLVGPTTSEQAPWAGHEVSTYDRLSVLLAEILRLNNIDDSLDLRPAVPLSLVSRVVI
jgi:DNA polymerase-3 subunit epsilon